VKYIQLSIIIPAYNEECRIGATLLAYAKFFKKKIKNLEIIVVCDGTDNTDIVVRKIAIKYKFIKLLKFPHRLGKGGGVYEGFKAAKGDIIGFADADNSIEPIFFDRLIQNLKFCDCAIGSRRGKGAKMILPQGTLWIISMRIVSRIFNTFANLILWLGVKDTQCGAKIMKRSVYRAIKNDLKATGFEFDVELLWYIKKYGYRIYEVPVVWKHNLESKSSIKNSYKFLILVLKLRLGI
jgi:glycosyltransferase involved in cell wall biosynthesis